MEGRGRENARWARNRSIGGSSAALLRQTRRQWLLRATTSAERPASCPANSGVPMSLDDLPGELLLAVCALLDPKDIGCLLQVPPLRAKHVHILTRRIT